MILQSIVLADLANGLTAGGIRGRINKGVDRLFDHIVRPVLERYWVVQVAS